MTWLWVAVVVAVLGVVIAIVVGRISAGAMPEVAPDRPAAQLSAAPLTDADLTGIRFTQTLRGYAMDEVDDFIERLRGELAARPVAQSFPAPSSAPAQALPVEPVEPSPQPVEPSPQPVEPVPVDVEPRP